MPNRAFVFKSSNIKVAIANSQTPANVLNNMFTTRKKEMKIASMYEPICIDYPPYMTWESTGPIYKHPTPTLQFPSTAARKKNHSCC